MEGKVFKNPFRSSPFKGMLAFLILIPTTVIIFIIQDNFPENISQTLYVARVLCLIFYGLVFIQTIYWIIVLHLEKSEKYWLEITTKVKKFSYRYSMLRVFFYKYWKFKYYLIPKEWWLGFEVNKEIFDAFNEGDEVKIIYTKFSHDLIEIRRSSDKI